MFTEHADGLLVAYGSLTQLLSRSPLNSPESQQLPKRAETLVARGVCFSYPGSPSSSGLRPPIRSGLRRSTLIVAPTTGKTIALICGVLTADAGTLQIDGVACSDLSRDDFTVP